MLERIGELFENMDAMMYRVKKQDYEKRMGIFRERHGELLQEMTFSVEEAEDREAEAKRLAEAFADVTKEKFSKRGRISPRRQVDINFFMIYYVFPAILLTESECAVMLADAVRDEWRVRFRESGQLNYADYNEIYNAFSDKIMGLF